MSDMSYFNKIGYNFLIQSQFWSKEKIEELQAEGLRLLIEHAKSEVPYYKRLKLPNVRSLSGLKSLPMLTKKLVHDNFNDLIATNIPHFRKWTGGTSEQVVIMSPLNQNPFLAGHMRFDSWHPKEAWKPYGRQAVIWGAGEMGHGGPHPTQPFLRRGTSHGLWGRCDCYFFPIEQMVSETVCLDYLRKIQAFNPTSIRCYASAIRQLSYYALKHNIKLPELKCFINNCEPLSDDIRKLVREAFSVEIFNFYGSQDLGSMGAECNKHEGLHLNMERYILEVTRDGRLIWTDLLNYAMPLIRYENGDIGRIKIKPCSCGRGLILLENVVGRTLQYLLTKQGDWLNMTEINESMYYDIPNYLDLIEAHQVEQTEKGKMILWLKAWDMSKLPDTTIIQRLFADRIDIDVQYTDKMKRSSSGKQLACITKFRPPWINTENWTGEGQESRADVK